MSSRIGGSGNISGSNNQQNQQIPSVSSSLRLSMSAPNSVTGQGQGQGPPQKAVLNAASLAQMLPVPQMLPSDGSPYIAYPIVRYAAGVGGSHSLAHMHQILAANPGWGYGLQGHQLQSHQLQVQNHLMGNVNVNQNGGYQIPPALINSQASMLSASGGSHHSMPLMHHHPRSHVQPHPNALLSSLAVAQAYQANMAAMSSSKPNQTPEVPPSSLQMIPGVYRDLAKDPFANDPDDEDTGAVKDQSFTVKLHRILADDEFKEYICWLPHGRSFKVLKQDEFEEKVIPLFYRHGKFASFMRQVNGWGFRRMSVGPDRNSYYHEMFLRGYPHLCAKMRRPLHKIKSTPETKTHPNFHDAKLFVELPKDDKEPHVIASVSTFPTNHDTSSDSNGRGGFDTDTTNTGTNDGSGSDRGLNMSNLYGSSGGSEQGSNMYGSGGSDQGSNLYASGGSDQGSNLYGSGESDQGSNLYGSSGENNSSNGDQDSNQDTSNDNSSDGTGSENGGDQPSGGETTDTDNQVSISGVVGGVEMKDRSKSSFPKSKSRKIPKTTTTSSRVSSSSETDEKSNSSSSPPRNPRKEHRKIPHRSSNGSNKPLSFSNQRGRPKSMAAPNAKKPRLSSSNNGGVTSRQTSDRANR